MKTFFDILKKVSNLQLGKENPNPDTFDEVWEPIKLAVKMANSYIWNAWEYSFKERVKSIGTQENIREYEKPAGTLLSILCVNNAQNTYLEEIENPDLLDLNRKGKPTGYWFEIQGNENKLVLFPIPDKEYNLKIRFNTSDSAIDMNGKPQINLENEDDTINIPSECEDNYINCLQCKSMEYLIADSTDENYVPYQKMFNENFKRLREFKNTKKEYKVIV